MNQNGENVVAWEWTCPKGHRGLAYEPEAGNDPICEACWEQWEGGTKATYRALGYVGGEQMRRAHERLRQAIEDAGYTDTYFDGYCLLQRAIFAIIGGRTMKCETCQQGPEEGVTVYRQNPLGGKGIWRCLEHNEVEIEEGVSEIVAILGNPKGKDDE